MKSFTIYILSALNSRSSEFIWISSYELGFLSHHIKLALGHIKIIIISRNYCSILSICIRFIILFIRILFSNIHTIQLRYCQLQGMSLFKHLRILNISIDILRFCFLVVFFVELKGFENICPSGIISSL